MTVEIFLVFLVVAGALYLFVTEKLPVDMTAFLILITLMLLGLKFPESFPDISEGLSGLASPATITVLAMFVLSAGVQKTGIIHILGRRVFSFAGDSEVRQILVIVLLVAPISGFINNTAAVAIMLPMVIDLAHRSGTPATKLLIPLSFFGMLGGTLTIIGTSTNILAISIVRETGEYPEVGLFAFTKLGIIVLLIGFAYFVFAGRFLLPNRKTKSTEGDLKGGEELFLTEVVVEKGGRLVGQTIRDSKFEVRNDVQVLKLIREKKSFIKNLDEKLMEEGDILLLRASEQRIIDLIEKESVKLLPNFDEEARRLPAGKGKIIKIMLRGAGIFHDRSLDKVNFWRKFSAAVVGIQATDTTSQRLGSMKLQVGQVLLAQASLSSFQRMRYMKEVLLLETIEQEYNREKMWLALGIVFAVIMTSAVFSIPIVVSALAGVLAMVLTKCINTDEMYASINWEIIFLLAGVIPLGVAMQKSGAAEYLADGIVGISNNIHPIFLLGLFYLITTMLTEIISNNAAVALLIPIALSVAIELNVAPFPLVLAVMFAASTSFLTPVGYQTNTMVYGSANYKFFDFIKVGAPLNIILLFVTTFFIWHWWWV
jgi:di/tricarboxylate transporter